MPRARGYDAQFCVAIDRLEQVAPTQQVLALDVGLMHFVSDNPDNPVENPHHLRKSQRTHASCECACILNTDENASRHLLAKELGDCSRGGDTAGFPDSRASVRSPQEHLNLCSISESWFSRESRLSWEPHARFPEKLVWEDVISIDRKKTPKIGGKLLKIVASSDTPRFCALVVHPTREDR